MNLEPPPTEEEIDTLLSSLRYLLTDATTGPYAEKKWGRSVEVEIFIIEDWRRLQQTLHRQRENSLPAVSRASHYS